MSLVCGLQKSAAVVSGHCDRPGWPGWLGRAGRRGQSDSTIPGVVNLPMFSQVIISKKANSWLCRQLSQVITSKKALGRWATSHPPQYVDCAPLPD